LDLPILFDDTNRVDWMVPSSLSYCSSPDEVLLASGVECPDYSFLQHQTLFKPYGLAVAILPQCQPMVNGSSGGSGLSPARIVYQCCQSDENAAVNITANVTITDQTSSVNLNISNYCYDLPTSMLSPTLGRIVSSNPSAPNSLGAEYSLSCQVSDSLTFPVSRATSITCQSDGRWSNRGILGQYLVLDIGQSIAMQ
jgi:hypothetical protein